MEQSPSQEILGYQLRESAYNVVPLWPVARREKYLLNPETRLPLSADRRVWPLASLPDLADQVFKDFVMGPNEAPNGLNLYQLKGSLTRKMLSAVGDNCVVGIAVDSEVAALFRVQNSIADQHSVEPSRLQFLGFDVCDQRLTSGLMNCGVATADHEKLRAGYAASINPFGLFDHKDVAVRFASEIGRTVPEHAPFFPIGLFVVGRLRR